MNEEMTRMKDPGVANEASALTPGSSEPIAIIGIGCRFPGAETGPEEFWQALRAGTDAVREIPATRWPSDAIPGNRPEVRWGGLLREIDRFDAEFFGISPREARKLDPQQRLLLELAWEALEHASVRPEALTGSRTGVFITLGLVDYQHQVVRKGPQHVEVYDTTGTLISTAAGRISYTFGLQGPCMTVDTACSSSLVTVHLACQSLRSGESALALAGGVNLLLSPMGSALALALQALSPEGRCKTFDASANGFVRAEGGGMVVLKRLADAQRDGDRIWSVIRGSAINHDGRSTGLTAPSGVAQQAVVRQALDDAGLPPARLGYIEAHGTGTALGDPLEVEALKAVLGAPRSDGSRCAISSVKTNLGHLEEAAGIAGLIKAALILKHGVIPRHLHLRTLNPKISLHETPFFIPVEESPWPGGAGPRVAGVSSFGVSGTNAHVVLEEPPAEAGGEARPPSLPLYLLPLSARRPEALQALAHQFAEFLRDASRAADGIGADLYSIAYAASLRRSVHDERLVVVGQTAGGLAEDLGAWARGEAVPGVSCGSVPFMARPKVAFVFSGSLASDEPLPPGTAMELLREEPVFRAALQELDAALAPEAGFSVIAELAKEPGESRLSESAVAGPVRFALQGALLSLWRSLGVEPDAVVGADAGEVAAAYAAGALSLAEAARIVCRLHQSADSAPALWPGEAAGALRVPMASSVTGALLQAADLVGEHFANLRHAPSQLRQALSALIKTRVTLFLAMSPHASLRALVEQALRESEQEGAALASLRAHTGERRSILEALGGLHVHGYQVDFRRLYPVPGRHVQLPRYPWQRKRYWSESGPPAARPATASKDPRPAPSPPVSPGKWAAGSPVLLPLSGHTEKELAAAAQELASHLAGRPALELADVAFTLSTERAHRAERAALVAIKRDAVERDLALLAAGQVPASASRGRSSEGRPRIAFLFTGQGAVYPGMGVELYETSAVFREAIDRVAALVDPLLTRPLATLLRTPERALLDDTTYAQPAIFALQWALAELWRSVGIVPDVVLGHSVGEIAAACVAGVLSLEDAARFVVARGRAMGELPAGGAMVSIQAEEAAVAAAIADAAGQVAIAACNAPDETVISGAEERVLAIAAAFAARGVRTQRLTVSHAFHSPLIVPARPALESAARSLGLAAARIPMISSVSGAAAGEEVATAAGWVRQVELPVRFADALRTAAQQGVDAFVEIGPRPVLCALGRRCLPGSSASWLPSLRQGRPDSVALLSALGELYVRGASVEWSALAGGRIVDLPAASAQRRREEARSASNQTSADPRGGIFYERRWRPQPKVGGAAGEGTQWRVVGGGRLGDELAAALGAPAASASAAFELAEAVRGVVYLAPEDSELPAGVGRVLEDALRVAQAMARAGSAAGRERTLWIVTRGATTATSAPSGLAQAPLWSLGRVLALEHLDLRVHLLDLSPSVPVDVAAIAAEVIAPDGEDEIALADGVRRVARLARLEAPVPSFATQGVWVITGGLGALGLRTARWLVTRGARALVLVGRRGLATPGAAAAIAELTTAGATVRAVAADVRVRDEVARVLAEAASLGVLEGIVHAAGVASPRPLAELQPKDFAEQAAKIEGAWHLHTLTRQAAPRYFILFSSIAGVWGAAGQTAYGAANGFLDALVRARRAEGLPATSLAFGPWAGDGLATDAVRAASARFGLESLDPEVAVEALNLAAGDGAEVVVAAVDWTRFRQEGIVRRRPLSELTAPARAADTGDGWRARLLSAPVAQRTDLLVELVRAEVAQTLGLDGPEKVAPRRGFFELGMDSLMAVELGKRLERALGIALPSLATFNDPNAQDLAEVLATALAAADAGFDRPAKQPERAGRRAAEPAGRAQADERIAIVGIGCRMPGGIDDPQGLWDLLDEGRDAVRLIERFDPALYDPDPETPGRMYTRHAALLDDIAGFDPKFFGISPREAAGMDPQQRLLLEVAWHALEHAGQDPRALRGRRVGVFVGMAAGDYVTLAGPLADATGNMPSIAAGRLSFVLGLQGPSLAVDTACSSSLVALHLAVRSLRAGECETALVAGVNVVTTPATFIALSRLRALAPDGRCKTFSAKADGYGRGEGCAVVVLKPLVRALAEGDRVLAVIRGTAINHDGAASGLTVPNGRSQETTIRLALADAGVAPQEVSYLEAHGTGTALGDPIEVAAAAAVYGEGRPASAPLLLGTVKTNLGHLESAAGVAGLIKVALALGAERIPASLHCDTLNPRLEWERLPVLVAGKAQSWPRGPKPRIAGVSAFGLSGTNAHVIVEEAPAVAAPEPPARTPPLLPLSARTPERLQEVARRLAASLRQHPETPLAQVAAAAATCRTHLDERAAVLAAERGAALAALDALACGETPLMAVRASAPPKNPRIALVFAEDAGASAGQQLYAASPAFRAAIERCAAAIDSLLPRPPLPRPLHALIAESGGSGDAATGADAAAARVAAFAVGLGLAELWRSWGVTADVVSGYGVGAVVAACCEGRCNLEDALRAVAANPTSDSAGHAEFPDGEVDDLMARRVELALVLGSRTPAPVAGITWVPCLERGEDAWTSLGRALGLLYVHGAAVQWPAVMGAVPRHVQLPLYPFRADPYWTAQHAPSAGEVRGSDAATWPIAGRELDLPGTTIHHLLRISEERTPAVYDHVVFGRPVVAGVFHIAMILAVAAERLGVTTAAIEDLQFLRALLPEGEVELHATLEPVAGSDVYRFTTATRGERRGEWRTHCEGTLRLSVAPPAGREVLERVRAACPTPTSADELAASLASGQIVWGPRWSWMLDGQRGERCGVARLRRPPGKLDSIEGPLHPALLDNALGAATTLSMGRTGADADGTGVVPLALRSLRWHRLPSDQMWCVCWQRGQQEGDTWRCDFTLIDDAGEIVAEVEDAVVKRAALDRFLGLSETRRLPPLYALRWLPASTPAAAPHGRWLQAGEGGALGSMLAAGEIGCVRGTFKETRAEPSPGADVLFLWTAATELAPADEAARASSALLTVLRALAERPARLIVVTRGAQETAEAPSGLRGVGASVLWGLARAARAEQPELDLRLVDLDPAEDDAQAVRRLVLELSGSDTPEVAWRGGRRLAAQLAPLPAAAKLPSLRPDGVYVVTGGFGALGLAVAGWLAERGARRLLLIGRSGPQEAAQPVLHDLQERGVHVEIAMVDVADRDALAAVLAAVPVPLRGVVHAAGVLDDALLTEQTPQRLARVYAPKVAGTLHLHELTQGAPLDFFVLFSSLAGLFGSAGQSSYAAANSFLDGLAVRRRALGQPATSIAWGPWADAGMAARLDERARARQRQLGLDALTTTVGLSLLEQALASERTVLAAFAPVGTGALSHPLLAGPGKRPPPTRLRRRARLIEVPPAERLTHLLTVLREEAAAVLGLSDAEEIPVDRELTELGLDSLGVQDLRRRLMSAMDIAAPPNLLFAHPTPRAAAEFLHDEWIRATVTAQPPTAGEDLIEEEL